MDTYFELFSSQTLVKNATARYEAERAIGKICSRLLSGQLLTFIMAETRQDIRRMTIPPME